MSKAPKHEWRGDIEDEVLELLSWAHRYVKNRNLSKNILIMLRALLTAWKEHVSSIPPTHQSKAARMGHADDTEPI